MYPHNTKSIHVEQSINGSKQVLATGTYTILHADLQSSGTGATTAVTLYCGTPALANEILQTHVLPAEINVPMSYYCPSSVWMNITGIGTLNGQTYLNYVEYDIASSSPESIPLNDFLFVSSIFLTGALIYIWRFVVRVHKDLDI